jgi:hypothetical protein
MRAHPSHVPDTGLNCSALKEESGISSFPFDSSTGLDGSASEEGQVKEDTQGGINREDPLIDVDHSSMCDSHIGTMHREAKSYASSSSDFVCNQICSDDFACDKTSFFGKIDHSGSHSDDQHLLDRASAEAHTTSTAEDDSLLDDNVIYNDLLELQRSGARVVLPKRFTPPVTSCTKRARISASAESVAVVNWDSLSTFDIQDWLDLEELGGSPPWPSGITGAEARAELQRRRTS